MEPIVTLVVVSYNCKRWFERFFQSIQAQTIFDRCEILMVDNSSQDGSAEICRAAMAAWTNGRFVPTGGNYGFGGACNIGAGQARGKYLFFLNPDVWLEPACLAALVAHAEASTAKAFSALELSYDTDQFVRGSQGQGMRGFDIFGCPTPSWPGGRIEDLMALGSFPFIRRDFFLRLGGFDPEFFVYGEEMDISWRVRIAGEPIELVRTARVHHAASGCWEPAAKTNELRRFYASRNQLLILLKNARGPLLLLVPNFILLAWVEAVAGAVLSRRISFLRAAFFKPLADCWRLRGHVLEQRGIIRHYRQTGDWWWTRRYFRFEIGHWEDIKRFMKWKIAIERTALPARKSQT